MGLVVDAAEKPPPMTNAERQARWRQRHQGEKPAPVIHYRRPRDRRSRPQRWRDAVAELQALQAEYQTWLDSLPDNLRESPTAALLEAVTQLDLDQLVEI